MGLFIELDFGDPSTFARLPPGLRENIARLCDRKALAGVRLPHTVTPFQIAVIIADYIEVNGVPVYSIGAERDVDNPLKCRFSIPEGAAHLFSAEARAVEGE